MSTSNRGLALIVDDDKTNRKVLETILKSSGFDIKTAEDGEQAVAVFKENKIDIVFMDVMMPVMDGYKATRIIKSISETNDVFTPVIFLTALTDDKTLAKCIDAGGDEFISKPYNIAVLDSRIKAMERVRDLSRKTSYMYNQLRNDEELAVKVFSNAVLADNINNEEIRDILKPAEIFSGDMLVSAYSASRDINVLLGDFTGHGLTSAIGALPASEVFRAMTAKGYSLPEIVKTINAKLCKLLPTGMFMACQLVSIDNELAHVAICNFGMPPVYIRHNDKIISADSTMLPLGISTDIDFTQHVQYFDVEIGDRIIMSSDGVVEARNKDDQEYSDNRLVNIINNYSSGKDEFIIDHLYADLEDFCDQSPQNDDISIAEIRLSPEILPPWDIATISEEKASDIEIKSHGKENTSCVEFTIKNCGENIKKLDPVPQIVNNVSQIISTNKHSQSIFTILTELYVNALDHGILGLDSSLKKSPEGFSQYFKNREKALGSIGDAFINISIKIEEDSDKYVIIIRIEDSGKGFDISGYSLNDELTRTKAFGRGIALVQNLCHSLQYELPGNIVEAIYVCNRDL